jgi:hypothetical protein
MSRAKIEIGINIVQSKENGSYYQSTIQYHFFPSIHQSTSHRISWLEVTKKVAMEVIEKLKLEKKESNLFINWSCLQERRSDAYHQKTIQYWKNIRLVQAARTESVKIEINP